MKFTGYKFSGYDATYRKALFNVCERGDCVLEITDLDSGTTFLADFDSASEQAQNRRTSRWRKDEPKEQGTTITFGSKGLFEQLMYEGKKCKISKEGGAE